MPFNLHLSEKANEAGPQRINLKLQFRSAAHSRIQQERSLGVEVHDRLVVLAESNEMRERAHERLELREALTVRARYPSRADAGWPTRIVFLGRMSS